MPMSSGTVHHHSKNFFCRRGGQRYFCVVMRSPFRALGPISTAFCARRAQLFYDVTAPYFRCLFAKDCSSLKELFLLRTLFPAHGFSDKRICFSPAALHIRRPEAEVQHHKGMS